MTITGRFDFTDSHSIAPATGYILLDSTRLTPDMTFQQGHFLGWATDSGSFTIGVDGLTPSHDLTAMWASGGDPPIDKSGELGIIFHDKTYMGGTWDGTVLRDCTMIYRYFDPTWLNYSVWYVQDASNPALIDYRYREPIRRNVGNYYASMVVPSPSGHYEARWRYEKDNSSYAHEVVQPFLSRTAGVDPDRT